MKNYIVLIIIGVIAIGLLFTSCDPSGPDPSETVVEITSDITSPTTWTADKVYIIKKVDFYVENVLTIEAGAVVKFPQNYQFLTLSGSGKILAQGTSEKPIVFTSYFDDSNGGDSNEDGGTTIPAAGDWGNIDLNGTNGSEFHYCKFFYGGFGTELSTLNLSAGSLATINHCTFAYNRGGISNNFYVGALNADGANTETTISNNTFYNNILPLSIKAEINIDNSNIFTRAENTTQYNGIFVSGAIYNSTSWLEDEVAFVLTSSTTQISIGKNLTLGENVVIKFVQDAELTVLSGEPFLINHDGTGVYFTSFKDDDHKGDTNGDGLASSPNIADWKGVFLDEYSEKFVGYAEWDNILYNDPNAVVK
ncbi:MAG: hypothetical protein PHH30_08280 [Bacteroidales bacterium]|nr:hypothetical protein [Bacteroidales bacterium]MDD3858611.1 hypothetical protein [Bacteroidales bacterium]